MAFLSKPKPRLQGNENREKFSCDEILYVTFEATVHFGENKVQNGLSKAIWPVQKSLTDKAAPKNLK